MGVTPPSPVAGHEKRGAPRTAVESGALRCPRLRAPAAFPVRAHRLRRLGQVALSDDDFYDDDARGMCELAIFDNEDEEAQYLAWLEEERVS
jgi:hypothetical protein